MHVYALKKWILLFDDGPWGDETYSKPDMQYYYYNIYIFKVRVPSRFFSYHITVFR